MSNIDALIEELEYIDDQIAELHKPINDEVFKLNKKKAEIEAELNPILFMEANKELQKNDYGCGTDNFETANFKIKVVVSKRVKWDEKELKKVANLIREGGQNPEDYIKFSLSVGENEYKKFDPAIQAVFVPAREVVPSKPAISWERK